jgi:hypothetical protein
MMKKETYLQLREHDRLSLMYELYKERFDINRHKRFLLIDEFLMIFNHNPMFLNTIMESTIKYYDRKYNVIHIMDKDGKYIKTV